MSNKQINYLIDFLNKRKEEILVQFPDERKPTCREIELHEIDTIKEYLISQKWNERNSRIYE